MASTVRSRREAWVSSHLAAGPLRLAGEMEEGTDKDDDSVEEGSMGDPGMSDAN